jgi:hypothetical protein
VTAANTGARSGRLVDGQPTAVVCRHRLIYRRPEPKRNAERLVSILIQFSLDDLMQFWRDVIASNWFPPCGLFSSSLSLFVIISLRHVYRLPSGMIGPSFRHFVLTACRRVDQSMSPLHCNNRRTDRRQWRLITLADASRYLMNTKLRQLATASC